MLRAVNLTKKYGQKLALDRLNLSVAPGNIYSLLGPNGAGKTTTINCFLGFIKSDSGSAIINGIDATESPQLVRKHIAYIPEQVNLYGCLTGAENLGYFSKLGGLSCSKTQINELLQEVGLQQEAFSKPLETYSKGMRQKVGIAIALAKKAKVLLLDEPTSGLDPHAANEFNALLKRISGEGIAVLMATHDLFRAHAVANNIGIMRNGRLVDEFDAQNISPIELENKYLEAMKR
ncbi:ABC transporter ATP-binding protein [Aliiglaciecola sp. NS0011-25]|uniref:ABC transporter ATP-binding protein n=1 Tax=Aliiglaciecola sp. NS0011-25 TaxID=3127654 RepID=UPI003109086E